MNPRDRAVILTHWKKTPAYVVAQTPPCLDMARQASLPRGRRFESLRFAGLEHLQPSASWAMAVLLCPGDVTDDVAAWATAHGADEERFLFIQHPDTDLGSALAAWKHQGFPPPQMVEATSWRDFARLLGQHVNNVILRDHGAGWVE